MCVPGRTFNFGVAMRFCLLGLLCFCSVKGFTQDKKVDGIIFDKITNARIAIVNVKNVTTGRSVYDNLKGEFTIEASIGDILVFTKQDYFADTMKVENYNSTAIYLRRMSIQLSEVTIRDTVLNPQAKLAATQRDYNKIYGSELNNKDFLTTSPGGGAGIGIDAIYNSLSKSGHDAARLRNEIQEDYYQNVIDYRFNRTFVGRITGLKDEQLTEFMKRYRPGYWFVMNANDYDFITSIKANYKRYLRRLKAYSLQPLQSSK